MRKAASFGVVALVALASGGAVVACRTSQVPPTPTRTDSTSVATTAEAPRPAPPERLFDDEGATGKLVAFKDEDDFASFQSRWKENELAKQRKANPRAYPMNGPGGDAGAPPMATTSPVMPSPPAAPAAAAESKQAARGRATDSSTSFADKGNKAESITNNQHADVDEGDIVKLHKDHLVVLRRGRLFTVSLTGDRPRLSKMVDAFGPDLDPRGTWYDEMVVDGDDVVVVGFSYARGGTELGLFKIDGAGQLTYRATYHLRSNDYYSARNYASRIVDGRLVFYAPSYLHANDAATMERFPAVRRWTKGAAATDFKRTLPVTKLYRMENEVPSSGYAALHTVTSCDLRAPTFACESIGIVGPPGRVFYVSPENVYVWAQDWARHADANGPSGLLARLPITRKAAPITAARVMGMPTDQFSFEEDESGALNVLVRAQSNGDAMFASEKTAGATALLRVPRTLFSDGVPVVSSRRYRDLPRPDGWTVQNRFVGPWLLYGAGAGYVRQHKGGGQLVAVRYAASDEPTTITLDQGVDRIEPMGDDAVVVGSRGQDLVFTSIGLDKQARAASSYVRKNASQGELRSHGFFYKPTGKGPREGMVGLPIRNEGSGQGARYLREGSASVLFLRHQSLELSELGALAASPLTSNHDGCRASCVDWYGNARPIFARGRIFALMGYELVEGKLDGATLGSSKMLERSRMSFAPVGGAPAADDWD